MNHLLAALLLLPLAACSGGDACVAEGDGFDTKLDIPGPCCDGLTAMNTTLEADTDGECALVDLDSSRVCLALGDGVCADAENECNSPNDCR